MNTADLVEMIASGAPRVIQSDAELDAYTEVLFELTGKDNPSESESALIQLLDLLIEKYEGEHYPIPAASPIDVLRYLMESNSLRQQDLVPVLGSLPLVSLILAGKRNLTVTHIQALAERFHVSPAVFMNKPKRLSLTQVRVALAKAKKASSSKRSGRVVAA